MIKTKDRVRDHGEVFTPQWLVKDMCDLVDSEIRDINKKILQPSCGNGNFIMQLLKRRLEIKDLNKDYILASIKTLYGVDILEDNIKETKQRVLDYINEHIEIDEQFKLKIMQILDSNIICTDWIKDDVFDCIQFDLVITNPPYQKKASGDSNVALGSSASYWTYFLQKSIKQNAQDIIMITPARWLSGITYGHRHFLKNILKSNKLKTLVDFSNSMDCFKTVSFTGGVCYYHYKKSYSGKVTYKYKLNDKWLIDQRFLQYQNFNFTIRDKRVLNILNKINYSKGRFSKIILPVTIFRFRSRKEQNVVFQINSGWKGYGLEKTEQNRFKYYVVQKNHGVQYGWISQKYINANINKVKDYKKIIIRGKLTKTNYLKENYIRIINKNQMGNQSYIHILNNNTGQDDVYLQNIIKYMKTKFFMFLLTEHSKSSRLVKRNNFNLIPIIDFTKQWTDKLLYKEFNLSDDDVKLIESIF